MSQRLHRAWILRHLPEDQRVSRRHHLSEGTAADLAEGERRRLTHRAVGTRVLSRQVQRGRRDVKDTKRYADTGGWGYYNFNHFEPKAKTATVKSKDECSYCHQASAKKDEVWTQFYPRLDH